MQRFERFRRERYGLAAPEKLALAGVVAEGAELVLVAGGRIHGAVV
jgi:hypothetical protein